MNYQSEQTNLVCQAIEDARLEFLPLQKDGVNNYFKNKKGDPHLYSTLDNIFDACMPALHKYKLSVVYQVRILETNGGVENVITTTITHLPSTQFILSATTLGNQTAKSQDVGSAITYLRRYQIQAMLNLEADFDLGEINKATNTMLKHHSWCSATIIQLQDIMGWAEELPKEHLRSANTMIKKCKEQIKFIKGE